MWRLTPAAENVGAHHEDAGGARFAGSLQAGGDPGKVGVVEGRDGVVEGQPVVGVEVVGALGEGADLEARAVEQLVAAHAKSISISSS